VFVVDDHPIVRAGVRLLLHGLDDFTVCGETGRVDTAPEEAAAADPGAVITDLMLGGGRDGLGLVSALRAALPDARLLVFSMHPEHLFAERALQSGADGYLMKGGDLEELKGALLRVAGGDVHLSPAMRRHVENARILGPRREGALAALTDREMQVYLRIGSGLTNPEIAQELGVSVKTVSAHRENLKVKLGVGSAPELVRHAVAYVLGRGARA